jgi:pseudaminic acid synthase
MKISGREIGPHKPPYIVAEVGASHGGELDTALGLIHHAKFAGADAVKFQCYTADTITIDCDRPDFIIKDGPWRGRKLYDLYSKAHTPFEWFPILFNYAKELGITIFSSVFDKTSVDLLEGLGCPAYKIASMEIVDTDLIEYAAKTGKPMVISTGMANGHEITLAVAAAGGAQASGAPRDNIALLHCVSGYPTPVDESNLSRMHWLQRLCDCKVGISDHTLNEVVPVAATVLGAAIIEKHIGLYDVANEDDGFSMTPARFEQMVLHVRAAHNAVRGSAKTPSEDASRQFRRSLYVVEDMKAGELFSRNNVRSIRPAYGMAPHTLDNILGRRATRDIKRGTPLSLGLMKLLNDAVDSDAG